MYAKCVQSGVSGSRELPSPRGCQDTRVTGIRSSKYPNFLSPFFNFHTTKLPTTTANLNLSYSASSEMGSEWRLGGVLVTFVLVTLLVPSGQGRVLSLPPQPQPPLPREFHPIDICIFSCDICFKGETLVNCANECIASEAVMPSAWRHVCSALKSQSLNQQDFLP